MNIRIVCILGLAFLLMSNGAGAVTKKKSKAHFRLIEAYMQRTMPGIPGAQVKTDYYFIVKWEAKTYPETFFWRGENGWLTCNTARAHRAGKDSHPPRGIEYRTEPAAGDQVHKGDTLMLKPIVGGKFPVPAEIPADAKNTLYYKTGGSGWLAFPVKNITKKPDVAMP